MKFKKKFNSLAKKLIQPVDASSIALFRIFFGLILVYEFYRYYSNGRIESYFINPEFLFPLLPFALPLPGEWMFLPFILFGLGALGIALGFYFRYSAFLFFCFLLPLL